MNSGIYQIRNIKNGRIYIGSAVDFSRRWRQHKSDFRLNRHFNPFFQNAWNKDGEKNFVFEILEFCEKDKIIEREQWWINNAKCMYDQNGYNFNPTAGNCLGRKHREESKKKMSMNNGMRGRTKEKHPNWGKHHTLEAIRKIKEARAKQVITEEHKSKLRLKFSGEKSVLAKLTEIQAEEIRQKYEPYIYSLVKLAKEYNVSKKTILNVLQNRTYKKGENK